MSTNKIKTLPWIIILFFSCNSHVQKMNSSNNIIKIIPKPISIAVGDGELNLNSITAITLKHNSKSEEFVAQLFQKFLRPVKWINLSKLEETSPNQIIIDLDPKLPIPHEGYNLSIGENQSIILKASTKGQTFKFS